MTAAINEAESNIRTQCAIVGGGPAGMVLGLLLARGGVDCVVLEKHRDFLRDFRGDTIHPSTLEVMHELGLLEELLQRPYQKVQQLRGLIEDVEMVVADFSHLPTRCPFIALMPQWDFLNFIADKAKRTPSFHLRMETEATALLRENGRVTGVQAKTPQGALTIHANLVVGADGRRSIVREQAGLEIKNLGAPIDVLWMRLSRRSDDTAVTAGRFKAGKILVMLNRDTYWQCGYVIPKGGIDDLRNKGLDALRGQIADIAPFLRERLDELHTWDDVKLLTVSVDRLRQWYRPGLLCIGDAAHAMSPVGGVGINLAIQDAVAAANRLTVPLRNNRDTTQELRRIQRRRSFPTVVTQWLQVFIQNNLINPTLNKHGNLPMPMAFRLPRRWPWLQRIPARVIGLGIRPEHVRIPRAT